MPSRTPFLLTLCALGAGIAVSLLALVAIRVRRLSSPFYEIRHGPDKASAAYALGEMGRQAEPAIGNLSVALSDGDPEVRIEAAIALLKIGTQHEKAIAVFLDEVSQFAEDPTPLRPFIDFQFKRNSITIAPETAHRLAEDLAAAFRERPKDTWDRVCLLLAICGLEEVLALLERCSYWRTQMR
jgi:hypothetical protein